MAKKNSNNGFSERLSYLLKEKQLTLAQVANAIGTSTPSVHRWTHGGEIDYANLRSLADFLEVNWIWLRYGDEAIANAQDNLPEQNSMIDMRRKYLSEIMESEARMKSALEMAQVVCWEWNVLSGKLTFSENAIDVFGANPEEYREALLPFENLSLAKLLIQFKDAQPFKWDFNLKSHAREEGKWFGSRGTLLKDSMQRPLKVVAISTDISDRKRAEKALESSELMMRSMIEIIPVGLFASDKSGTICILNPEVRRIWGGEKLVELERYGEYKGWRDSSGEELGSDGWPLARAFKYGEVCEKETVNIESFDGQKKTILVYAAPLLDSEKNIIGAVEVNQDITEMKQIESHYKSGHERWRSIFDQEDIGVAYIEELEEIREINDKLAEISGNEIVKIVGKSTRSLFDEETCLKIRQSFSSTKKNRPHVQKVQGKLKKNSEPSSGLNLSDIEIIILNDKRASEKTKSILLISEINAV